MNVTNYQDTNLTGATQVEVQSNTFGVVIIVFNENDTVTLDDGTTVTFANGVLTFTGVPSNTQLKIQVRFSKDACTTAWSNALSFTTPKEA